MPDVPFQMLTAIGLTRREWAQVARRGSWQMIRMNLNTFARHGVFNESGMTDHVAGRLRDASEIARARVFPYQLLATYRSIDPAVPSAVRRALEDAMELAIANTPQSQGRSTSVLTFPVQCGHRSRATARELRRLFAASTLPL